MVTRILFPAGAARDADGLPDGFHPVVPSPSLAPRPSPSFEGLGHRIVRYAEALNMPMMFAYILFVVLVAALMNMLVSASWSPGCR